MITSGRQERHQRQRARVGADVVQRDARAHLAQTLRGRQQLGRPVGERALGELDEHGEALERGLHQLGDLLGQLLREHPRIEVDEQRLARGHAHFQRSLERRPLALPLDLDLQALGAGGGEQVHRTLQTCAGGTSRERLVADRLVRVQVHQRLVDGHHPLRLHELGDRQGGGACGARTHGGGRCHRLIDRRPRARAPR